MSNLHGKNRWGNKLFRQEICYEALFESGQSLKCLDFGLIQGLRPTILITLQSVVTSIRVSSYDNYYVCDIDYIDVETENLPHWVIKTCINLSENNPHYLTTST